jgi:hypothetical protein
MRGGERGSLPSLFKSICEIYPQPEEPQITYAAPEHSRAATGSLTPGQGDNSGRGLLGTGPGASRDFSPNNLENLVKYAYFAGFIDMSQVIRLLFLKRGERSQLLHKWYEEIRENGCWPC